MLTAYFDDSGTSTNEPVVVVAGYLGTVAMWNTFDNRWKALLARNDISQMHRADLENLAGEFKGWTPARRTAFLIKAHAIIRKYTYLPIGLAVIKSDLEDVFPEDSIARRFKFYSWCVHGCLAGIGEWFQRRGKSEPVNFVFEAGRDGRDQVDKTFALLYANPEKRPLDACPIASWSFAGKSILPLQAADVVAYEFYKFTKNEVVDQRKRKIRLSTLDLFRNTDLNHLKHFDKNSFERIKKTEVPGWWS